MVESLQELLSNMGTIAGQRITEDETINPHEDYEAKEDCPQCNGWGWIVLKPPEGKPVPCNAPGCLKESHSNYRKSGKQAEMRGVRLDQSFENFIVKFSRIKVPAGTTLTAINKSLHICRDAALKWVAGDIYNLLIYGSTGNGKSHLLNAAAYALNAAGAKYRLFTTAALLNALRSTQDKGDLHAKLMDYVTAVEFLLLDEFKHRTDWQLNILEDILGFRHGHDKRTFIVSNLDIKKQKGAGDFDYVSARVSSRFMDSLKGQCILNEGLDYRLAKNKL